MGGGRALCDGRVGGWRGGLGALTACLWRGVSGWRSRACAAGSRVGLDARRPARRLLLVSFFSARVFPRLFFRLLFVLSASPYLWVPFVFTWPIRFSPFIFPLPLSCALFFQAGVFGRLSARRSPSHCTTRWQRSCRWANRDAAAVPAAVARAAAVPHALCASRKAVRQRRQTVRSARAPGHRRGRRPFPGGHTRR